MNFVSGKRNGGLCRTPKTFIAILKEVPQLWRYTVRNGIFSVKGLTQVNYILKIDFIMNKEIWKLFMNSRDISAR